MAPDTQIREVPLLGTEPVPVHHCEERKMRMEDDPDAAEVEVSIQCRREGRSRDTTRSAVADGRRVILSGSMGKNCITHLLTAVAVSKTGDWINLPLTVYGNEQ